MTPHRVAVRHGDRSLTYAELDGRVNRLAHRLREWGVRAGDRVAYLGPNHPVHLETLFAAGLLGALFVPINVRLVAAEIEDVLADSGAVLLIHTPDQRDKVAELGGSGRARVLELDDTAEDLRDEPDAPIDEPVHWDDACLILYTSGSTGRPKGAVLTHGNLTWNCTNVLVETDLHSDERALIAAPLFHAATLGMVCLPTLLKGGTAVLLSAFEPGAVLDEVERRGITIMFGVPAMFDAVAAHPKWSTADLSSVRTLLCGGAPVPESTIRRYLARGLSFIQGYGMTETAPGALILDREHVVDKIGSAGVPSFFTDVRVVDELMGEVGAGERGEVVVQGPNVMRGYWGKPDETAAVLRDGWFHSGDLATVDEDGYTYIVDRLKDMIISGGENIYPAEVEKVLLGFGGVRSCAVIGVADDRWGEVGRAVVVAEPGCEPDAAELLAFAREHLAGYKVPKSVRFVPELPLTGSGKVFKSRVRAEHGD